MAKKLKLPKRVAGIKIPKRIRKGPVGDFINSRAGQLVIAQALVLAAGVFTASKADSVPDLDELAKHPVKGAKQAGRAAVDVSVDQGERLTYALKEAAHAFRNAMLQGPSAGESLEASSAQMSAEAGAKKKSSPQQREPAAAH
jgi:hypothetical protein